VADRLDRPDVVTIRARSPDPSRACQWLTYLALPWLFGVILVGDAIATALGFPLTERPAVRGILGGVAVAPGVVVVAYPWLGRVPGFRWLVHPIHPRAKLDQRGIELSLPGLGVRFFPWEAVERLVVREGWTTAGTLIGTDGSRLASVPLSLLKFQDSWRSRWAETLASRVVAVRPDRYAISGASASGLPHEFALTGLATGYDPAVAEQRRVRLLTGFLIALMGFTALAIGLWIFLPR
jgi:hypothetical protein